MHYILEPYFGIFIICRGKEQKGKGPLKKPSNPLITYTSNKKRKEGSSSSSVSNQVVIVEEEPEGRLTRNAMIKKGIESTRFPSKKVLVELGLYDELKALFGNIGWESILDDTIMDRRTYKAVVLEVLSTIKDVESVPGELKGITFQLYDDTHEGSLKSMSFLECQMEELGYTRVLSIMLDFGTRS